MTLTELLFELDRAGVALYLDDSANLRIRGTVPEHLRPVISCRGNKGHIVGYLKAAKETVQIGKMVDSLPDGERKENLFQEWQQMYERVVFLESLELYLPKETAQELLEKKLEGEQYQLQLFSPHQLQVNKSHGNAQQTVFVDVGVI